MIESRRSDMTTESAVEKGIDHAWQWFSLHASQRLLAVDFFLVASAFLSAAYVSALHYSDPAVALGIGLLGAWSTVCFGRFEIRVRELLKAAEAALYPLQGRLADETGVVELNLCKRVEVPHYPFTSYNKVIKALHWVTGAAFTAGALWAAREIWPGSSNHDSGAEVTLLMVNRVTIILSGIACIYFAYKTAVTDREKLTWIHYALVAVLACAGLFILLLNAIRAH